ncbi:MAG: hypothetical protein ACJ8ED_01265, partial [Xanthobacteraceae bacterium]
FLRIGDRCSNERSAITASITSFSAVEGSACDGRAQGSHPARTIFQAEANMIRTMLGTACLSAVLPGYH